MMAVVILIAVVVLMVLQECNGVLLELMAELLVGMTEINDCFGGVAGPGIRTQDL